MSPNYYFWHLLWHLLVLIWVNFRGPLRLHLRRKAKRKLLRIIAGRIIWNLWNRWICVQKILISSWVKEILVVLGYLIQMAVLWVLLLRVLGDFTITDKFFRVIQSCCIELRLWWSHLWLLRLIINIIFLLRTILLMPDCNLSASLRHLTIHSNLPNFQSSIRIKLLAISILQNWNIHICC